MPIAARAKFPTRLIVLAVAGLATLGLGIMTAGYAALAARPDGTWG